MEGVVKIEPLLRLFEEIAVKGNNTGEEYLKRIIVEKFIIANRIKIGEV